MKFLKKLTKEYLKRKTNGRVSLAVYWQTLEQTVGKEYLQIDRGIPEESFEKFAEKKNLRKVWQSWYKGTQKVRKIPEKIPKNAG